MKKVLVISLGGSIIIPDKPNTKFLKKFKKTILKFSNKYKFIVVTGGGSVARKYIDALQNMPHKTQSAAGIQSTRANAKFVSCYFGQNPLQNIPTTIKEIKDLIKKQDIVFCGALGFKPKQTTDSNAAEIAAKFKTNFINLTNVKGLYNKNPKKHKDAKFIEKIGYKEMHKMAIKMNFKPGQHFVMDQMSSKIIMKNRIPSFIMGTNIKNFENFLKEKKFIGTIIKD